MRGEQSIVEFRHDHSPSSGERTWRRSWRVDGGAAVSQETRGAGSAAHAITMRTRGPEGGAKGRVGPGRGGEGRGAAAMCNVCHL
jgi:hypothetical protein